MRWNAPTRRPSKRGAIQNAGLADDGYRSRSGRSTGSGLGGTGDYWRRRGGLAFRSHRVKNGACSGDLSGMGLAQEVGYRTKRGVELEAECVEAVQAIATS